MRARLRDVELRFTGRREGDLGHAGVWVPVDGVDPAVAARREAVCPLPWTWLRQVHGDRVVTVTAPGEGAGTVADAAVTDRPGCPLVVLTADCAPVALIGDAGVIGVAHAGWRGLVEGVLERTVEAMRALGADHIDAVVGPCIRPECYEFGADDLDTVARRLGDEVRSTTAEGRAALDVPAGVRVALASVGVADVDDAGVCTACSDEHYSYRARQERERQALVLWQ